MVVTTGTVLPMRCVGTNLLCSLHEQWTRKSSYAPSFRLVGNRRHCRLYRCLSSQHRRDKLFVRGIISATIFVFLAMVTWTLAIPAIVSVIVLFSRPIDRFKVVQHRHGEFWIKGCHPEFLELLVTDAGWPRHVP